MRAKTDKLDATTIARLVLSGEARRGYVPTDLIATYRELARLQTQLTEDVMRYRNEIHALLQVLIPRVQPSVRGPVSANGFVAAHTLSKSRKPSRQRVESRLPPALHETFPTQLRAAHRSAVGESGAAFRKPRRCARCADTSLKIVCDQLEHTQTNLLQLEQALENLMKTDTGARGLQSVPEFAVKTIAVLRAKLGDVDRFACSSQAVAYAGLDSVVKQSGKSRGQAKLSKRGSGHIRRILYMAVVRCIRLKDSAFRAYYHHLVARGRPRRAAMMAVMRKMLAVAYLHAYSLARPSGLHKLPPSCRSS